jgi:hypothetical protein
MTFLKKLLLPICLIATWLFLVAPAPAYAAGTTYYVDATRGSDTNTGTAPLRAWKTVAKVRSTTLRPGDKVLFRRGEMWREELLINQSGSAGSPITLSAYGQGAKPIFNGADLIAGWSSVDTNRWQATVAIQPKMVLFDNTFGTQVAALANVTAPGTWYWESNTLYVYSTSDPAIAYANPGIEAQARNGGHFFGKSSISVQNLEFVKGKYGLWFHGAAGNATIVNVDASYNFFDGISIGDAGTDNATITDSTSHDNLRNGLLITGGAANASVSGGAYYNNTQTYAQGVGVNASSGARITGVTAYNNHYGLKVYGATSSNVVFSNNISYGNRAFGVNVDTAGVGIIVESNHVYANGKHGIAIEVNTPDTIVRYNTVHENGTGAGMSGIEVETGVNTQIYYNLVYAETEGIALYGATNPLVHNNTIYNAADACINIGASGTSQNTTGAVLKNNSVSQCRYYYLRVPTASQAGFASDYNNWFLGSEAKMRWGTTSYTFANWKTVTGQDTNSLNADPLYTTPSTANFTLQAASPNRDTATNLGLPRDHAGTAVPQGAAPDIGALEYRP